MPDTMPKLILLTSFCLIQLLTFSQDVLKGRVTASDNEKPIPLANVFLSNTSVGTITDENGVFKIDHFPSGRYDLVVSCIGYETFIITIQSNAIPGNLQVKLKPKVEELQEVIVEPYEKNGWEKFGAFFVENFMGTSAFSEECKIKNKEVIKFRYSKKHNTLQAFSDEPIVIENNALGYILKYSLTKFQFDYAKRICFYQGYPLFQEMVTKRKGLQKRWENNRKDAYYGSLMHFMRSLYRNRLVEENFEVRKLITVSEAEKARVKTIYQNQLKKMAFESRNINMEPNMGFGSHDSMQYYQKVMNRPEELNVVIDTLVRADSMVYAVDKTTLALDFSDHLQVVYRLKVFPVEYVQKFLTRADLNRPVTSTVVITSNTPIIVLANGSYFEGANFLTSGYWGWWEKIGNMLPFGYWPPQPPKTGTYFIHH